MPSLALLRIPCVLLALGLAATSPSAAAAAPYRPNRSASSSAIRPAARQT